MIKSILIYASVLFLLFFLGHHIHDFFIENKQIVLSFSLKKVYLFHFGFSLIICVNFLLLSNVNNIFEQLGFIYLGSIPLKLILFGVTFYKSIFTQETLTFVERLALFIPTIVFLLTEAIFIIKIINKKE